jgi:hypothetical protein
MIQIIGLAILGVMIAEWYSPIQKLKDYFKLYEHPIFKYSYCVKCVCFNLALIVTLNLYTSAIVCVLGYTISYIIDLIDRHRYE